MTISSCFETMVLLREGQTTCKPSFSSFLMLQIEPYELACPCKTRRHLTNIQKLRHLYIRITFLGLLYCTYPSGSCSVPSHTHGCASTQNQTRGPHPLLGGHDFDWRC
jgi:hypothetical protein